MIKQFLQRWLGIQELSDKLATHKHDVQLTTSSGPDRSSSPVATAPLPSQSDAEVIEAVKQAFDRAKDEIVVEIVDKGITGIPVYPANDPHPPKVVKGYEQSGK